MADANSGALPVIDVPKIRGAKGGARGAKSGKVRKLTNADYWLMWGIHAPKKPSSSGDLPVIDIGE